eukprot:m.337005 g.337005  ORF g.337005 m.337005 type:complete len:473 (-) comp18021_c0_seq1:173-1591(-)
MENNCWTVKSGDLDRRSYPTLQPNQHNTTSDNVESARKNPDRSVDKTTVWKCTLAVPFSSTSSSSSSPFAGCHFNMRVTLPSESASWELADYVWESEIYHPLLKKGKPLCGCIIRTAQRIFQQGFAESCQAAVLSIVAKLVESPIRWSMCPSCNPDMGILSEAMARPDFFNRKAKVHTPGAQKLTDADIVGGCDMQRTTPLSFLSRLLTTGEFSDIDVFVYPPSTAELHDASNTRKVDGEPREKLKNRTRPTVFRCHRTILANKCKSFAAMFRNTVDSGRIVIKNVEPKMFAKFLEFVYTDSIAGRESLTVQEFQQLGYIAHTCKVEDLRLFCLTVMQCGVSIDNICDLLVNNQRWKEPAHTEILLRFLSANLNQLVNTPAWCRLLSNVKGDALITLRKLSQAVIRKQQIRRQQSQDENSLIQQVPLRRYSLDTESEEEPEPICNIKDSKKRKNTDWNTTIPSKRLQAIHTQ